MNKTKNKRLVADKDSFFELLSRAIQPVYPSNDETKESQTSGDYNDKQTRQHKAEVTCPPIIGP